MSEKKNKKSKISKSQQDGDVDARRADEKSVYSSFSWEMLTILGGLFLFFPTISGYLSPPFVWGPFLAGFWIFAFCGLVLNFLAFYLSKYARKVDPEKYIGLGNLSTVLSILCFSIYLSGNIYNDKYSAVRINDLRAEPVDAKAGQWVTLNADAYDQDGDELTWQWEVLEGSKPSYVIGSRKTAFWRVPDDFSEDIANVVVTVTDDGNPVSDTLRIRINNSAMNEKVIKAYFEHRILLRLADLYPKRKKDAEALSADIDNLVAMAVENVDDLTAISHVPQRIDDALDNYLRILSEEKAKPDFKKDWRPCCHDFPGIWPFCKKCKSK